MDEDARLYYEVGAAYPIVSVPTESQKHFDSRQCRSAVDSGDVFFRRHAVNLRESQGAKDLWTY